MFAGKLLGQGSSPGSLFAARYLGPDSSIARRLSFAGHWLAGCLASGMADLLPRRQPDRFVCGLARDNHTRWKVRIAAVN
jgi:hypothetical protein